MSSAETSDQVATIAGRILAFGDYFHNRDLVLSFIGKLRASGILIGDEQINEVREALSSTWGTMHQNLHTLAGSALRQHEQEGSLFIPSKIEWGTVANAMIGVIETGSYSPWLHEFDSDTDDDNSASLRRSISARGDIWYADPGYWKDGGKARIRYDLESENEGVGGGTMTFGKAEIISGLATMAATAPKHFADLANENDDAITHDVLLQCIVFGKIVYG